MGMPRPGPDLRHVGPDETECWSARSYLAEDSPRLGIRLGLSVFWKLSHDSGNIAVRSYGTQFDSKVNVSSGVAVS
jgi:hypothetical protein